LVTAQEEKVPMDHDDKAGGPVVPLPERRDGESMEEWWARLTAGVVSADVVEIRQPLGV
jgi:hypothetical protein